jgi:D-alanyl-D-alanine carboxypeptidase/D-alanyl-D-alanine-endopeptidase (penicillin-binding protein 4)
MLKKSDSLVAELLLKELGTTSGHPTTRGGLEVVGQVARRFGMSPGMSVDGSGLSPLDRQTPLHEVNWLMSVERTPAGSLFRSSLPVACKEGTLQARLCGTSAAGRIFAKTGTHRGTVTLAGYTRTASGKRVWFAFMLSGARSIPQARKAIDHAAVALATFEG